MGRSPATLRAYGAAVDRYLAFCDTPAAGAEGGPEASLLRFLATRRGVLAQASMNIEASALRAWFGWLSIAMPDAWRPIQMPRTKRPPARVVRALSDAEVGLLLAAPDLTTYVGFRDHVIMATLYQCGLRASELAGLQVGSVLPDGLLLVHGKGGKGRLVPYGERWRGLLDAYLHARAGVRPGKRAALFLTHGGRPLRDGRAVWVIVSRYARRALGLHCGFTRLDKAARGTPWQGHYPHLLRASFATELFRRGVNLVAIADMLGHADVATTAHYLGMDLEQLRAAARCHPRARRQ